MLLGFLKYRDWNSRGSITGQNFIFVLFYFCFMLLSFVYFFSSGPGVVIAHFELCANGPDVASQAQIQA